MNAAAVNLEVRAARLADEARTRPLTTRAALEWIDLAIAKALRDGDELLADALVNHDRAIRAYLSKVRIEEGSQPCATE